MWTLQDAKNKFSAVVEKALAGAPQQVTRRGEPAVVVVSAVEYTRLLKAASKAKGGFVDHLLSFPAADTDLDIPRVKVRPRDVEF